MSKNIRFEDDTHSQKTPEDAQDDKQKRRSHGRKAIYDEAKANAAPADTSPVSTGDAVATPTGDAPAGSGNQGGGLGMGLQHGAAQTIRSFMPDETPDRNTGVSAVRFGMEVSATAYEKMASAGQKRKKSKLQNKDSQLKFEQDNAQTESGGENQQAEQTDNGNDSPAVDNTDSRPSPADQPTQDTATTPQPNPQNKDTSDEGEHSTADPSDTETRTTQSDPTSSATTTPDQPDSKLQFSKDEKKIGKLEKKADKYDKKLNKAKDKLPTKKVKKEQLVFDEEKGKTVSKLTHEKEKVPIGEAKWNQPKEKPALTKAGGIVTSMAVTKIHAKVHQVEHENTAVKAAHKAELMGESAYRGGKRYAKSAYRFHKNKPYRTVAKLEQKSIKNKIKLDYKKALRDNPKLKSNPVSRLLQKRAIKRNYAKDLRNAKNAARTGQKAVGITAKAAKVVTAIVRKNPVFLIKAGLILLIIFLILSMLTMCVGMFSGGSAFIGGVSYAAEYEDITDASVLYTELETDLRIYIIEIESNHPGFDEYRLSIDSIGHDPFALMAFLTAVYQDFTFAEVEATIQSIFDAHYTLELVPVVEIRTRTETRTGTGVDGDGNSYTYTYTVMVEYEWHILYVTLTSRPFLEVLAEMMNEEQTQHFNVLMYSKGARQFVGNPFAFDWRPFVTSPFGYRADPFTGAKTFHWGIDIGQPTGTPLHAGFTGTVVAVGYHPNGYGNFVVIEDEDGNQARYAHCHDVFVVQGQAVERGDVIATVGSTGASTGPHLHMEVSVNGRRINPIFFVDFR